MVRKAYVPYTFSSEARRSVYRAGFSWLNYLVLQRTECSASATVGRVKEEHTGSRGSARKF